MNFFTVSSIYDVSEALHSFKLKYIGGALGLAEAASAEPFLLCEKKGREKRALAHFRKFSCACVYMYIY